MQLPDPRERPVLTVEETAEILGCSRSRAYDSANAGEIPTLRLGRKIVVPTARLLALLGLVEGDAPTAA